MACTWFGEVSFCCSLSLLLGPAWVLLKYVWQTIFSGPVVATRTLWKETYCYYPPTAFSPQIKLDAYCVDYVAREEGGPTDEETS